MAVQTVRTRLVRCQKQYRRVVARPRVSGDLIEAIRRQFDTAKREAAWSRAGSGCSRGTRKTR